jgi:hypothetical protein
VSDIQINGDIDVTCYSNGNGGGERLGQTSYFDFGANNPDTTGQNLTVRNLDVDVDLSGYATCGSGWTLHAFSASFVATTKIANGATHNSASLSVNVN